MVNKLISRLILLRQDEQHTVYFLFLLAGLIGFGMSIGQVSSDALFFKLYGVDYLPYMFAIIAIVLFVSCLLYAAFVDSFTPHHMLLYMMIGFSFLVALSWVFMIGADEKTGFALYFIAYGVISELLLTHFYFYLTSFFDAQQAKRLLPPILGISLLGRSLGGIFVGAVGTEIPIQHIAFIWVICLFISIWLLIHKHKGEPKYNTLRPGQASKPIKMVHEGIMYAKESSLIRISAFSMFLVVFLYCVQEYLVGKIFVNYYSDEQELAKFFGWFSSILSLSVLVIQLFFSSRMLRFFGISNMNLIYPISTFLSFGFMAVSANYFSAVLGRINLQGMLPSIRNPIASLFNQALPIFMQGRVGALMTGAILPLGLLAAALFLSLIPKDVSLEFISTIGVLLSLFLCFVKYKKNSAYSDSLIELIGNSVLTDNNDSIINLTKLDKKTAFKLADRLKSTETIPIIKNYIEMLELLANEHAGSAMLHVYSNLPDQVKCILLPHIGKHSPKGWEKTAWKALKFNDPHLTETTILILLEAKYSPAIKKSEEWLNVDVSRIKAAAAVGCLHNNLHKKKSLNILNSLLMSPNPIDYLSALGALAVKPYHNLSTIIINMIYSDNERARALALEIWSKNSEVKESDAVEIINLTINDPSYIVRKNSIIAASRLHHLKMPVLKWLTISLRDIDFRVREAGLTCAKNFMPTTPKGWDNAIEKYKNNFELQQVIISELASTHDDNKDVLLRQAISEHLLRAKEKLIILQESEHLHFNNTPLLNFFVIALKEDVRRHIAAVLHTLGCLDQSKHMNYIRAGLMSDNRRLWAQSLESALSLKSESYIFRELSKLYEAEREGVKLKGNLSGTKMKLQDWLEWCRLHGSDWLSECSNFYIKQNESLS